MKRYTARMAFHTAAVASATGTVIDVGGLEFVCVQVTGISGDSIAWEATVDGSTWVGVLATNQTTGSAALTATANGLYAMNCAGYAQLRANLTRSAGTVTVTGLGM
jgi:hypothetical protein